MTTTSAQKTFYAKTFESVLRNYFKCPSKTKTDKPVAYIFLQNKDNKTGYYRTVDRGLSDVMLKSYANDTLAQEKYLTFFPYVNHFNGAFIVGKEHWNNFINAINIPGENTIWCVFCDNKNHFLLAHNTSLFIRHEVTIQNDYYTFDAYEIHPQDYISFTRSTNDRNDWICTEIKGGTAQDNVVVMKYENQYTSMLSESAQCFPLPRIGKKHLFCTEAGIVSATFTDISNKYHGTDTVDNFITKLRRNLKSNENQVSKDLRMKPVKDVKVIAIPDAFDEQSFIDWQEVHKIVNKTESMKDYMKQYRRKQNDKNQ
jgi:hypothetical protein